MHGGFKDGYEIEMKERALEGVRVIEYASLVAGPYCTKLLADLGAQVIKIERPGVGDEARRIGPFPNDVPHPERSGLFLYTNTNKLGITLAPGIPAGKKIFLALVEWADVLVEDRPPGAMAELGLSYDVLKRANPQLIMTSITPFGQTGPYRDYKAYGLTISHGAGAAYLTPIDESEEEFGPVKGGGFFDRYCNGLSAAAATLVALYTREMTGEGQHIDVSEQEASIAYDRVEISMFPTEGFISRRVRPGGGTTLLPCQDGYALIAMGEERHWKALVELMGNPEWTKDERFKDEESRFKHSAELSTFLARWTRASFKEELYRKLSSAGIPTGVVRSQGELMERDEQLKARGFFVDIEHPEVGKLAYPSAPYCFSETPWRVERPAPTLGQHNDEVYCGLLGYSRDDLAKLREARVI